MSILQVTRGGEDEDLHHALSRCREDIDRLDAVLIALLSERTRLAVHAGRMKAAHGEPIVAPTRETAVLARARALAVSPLDGDAAARIFERIIAETVAAERRIVGAS
jgi:chorismate mutase